MSVLSHPSSETPSSEVLFHASWKDERVTPSRIPISFFQVDKIVDESKNNSDDDGDVAADNLREDLSFRYHSFPDGEDPSMMTPKQQGRALYPSRVMPRMPWARCKEDEQFETDLQTGQVSPTMARSDCVLGGSQTSAFVQVASNTVSSLNPAPTSSALVEAWPQCLSPASHTTNHPSSDLVTPYPNSTTIYQRRGRFLVWPVQDPASTKILVSSTGISTAATVSASTTTLSL